MTDTEPDYTCKTYWRGHSCSVATASHKAHRCVCGDKPIPADTLTGDDLWPESACRLPEPEPTA